MNKLFIRLKRAFVSSANGENSNPKKLKKKKLKAKETKLNWEKNRKSIVSEHLVNYILFLVRVA